MNHVTNIEPGTILRVFCPNKMVWHYGIMSWNGRVIDRAKRGILSRTWREFSEGCQVEIAPTHREDLPKKIIHQRALSNIGQKGYHMIFQNCEHFVSWCRKGKFTSKQLNYVLIIIGIVIAVVLLLRSDTKKSQ